MQDLINESIQVSQENDDDEKDYHPRSRGSLSYHAQVMYHFIMHRSLDS